METVSGPNNWMLTARLTPGGVTLLHCATCDRRAALPETLWGIPVTALADHALAPSPPVELPEGNTQDVQHIRIVCGPSGDTFWDNAALQELTLPPSLLRVENYALYHCAALERIRLHDSVAFWGSGVLTGCRKLTAVEISQSGSWNASGNTLAYFTGELNQELDVTVTTPGGILRLVFPSYRELYEENSPAHHFDYTIEGAGYPYHHCFRNKKINLLEYDRLWKHFLEAEDPCALRLAWYRVRYPMELYAEAEAAYWDYLRACGKDTVAWLLGERDIPGLAYFLKKARPGQDVLSIAADLARRKQDTEALALLMEERHRRFPATDRFSL